MAIGRLAVFLLIYVEAALACKCVAGPPDPGRAFAQSEAVFAGRLVSTVPDILGFDEDKILSRLKEKYGLTDEQLEELEDSETPQALELKKEVLSEFLPAEYKDRIARGKTSDDLGLLVTEFLSEGVRFRIRVDESWKGPAQEVFEIWQELSSCAKTIDKDEPVLIYAWRDKKGRLTTHACDRGGPISEAGADLAYLYFVKYSPEASSRVSGWLTSDEKDLQFAAIARRVQKPVRGVEIELVSADGARVTASDSAGWFAIDGLREGSYTLTVCDTSYGSDRKRILKGPITISVPKTADHIPLTLKIPHLLSHSTALLIRHTCHSCEPGGVDISHNLPCPAAPDCPSAT